MTDIAIRVDNLSKLYHLGARQQRHDTLRDALTSRFRRAHQSTNSQSTSSDDLWALKDVSFEVKRGEVLGIIGRNGAGKSTLLKILSRITEPTSGRAEIHGRVGSLLEVGTGFHPELTGRENIFLNGAILGMRRVEIQRRFDEIVAFAEIERFLDTPVKRYSSGMYVRLAFAVAAHLEPEILLVDEVLAVGDAAFQKKCLGKMGDVASQGRTVLFVSHQMNAIQSLCQQCVLLSNGHIMEHGGASHVVSQYMRTGLAVVEWRPDEDYGSFRNPYFAPVRFALVDRDLRIISQGISADQEWGILIDGVVETLHSALTVGIAVSSLNGDLLFWSYHTDVTPQDWPELCKGHNRLVCWMPSHLLNEGEYRIELMVSLHFLTWISQPGVNAPSVSLSVRGGLSQSPHWMMARPGFFAPVLKFERIPP